MRRSARAQRRRSGMRKSLGCKGWDRRSQGLQDMGESTLTVARQIKVVVAGAAPPIAAQNAVVSGGSRSAG
jgi:hypothetical protein